MSTPVTYAINKPADVTPGPLTLTFEGLEFDARTPKGAVHVQVEAGRAPERVEHPRDRRRGDRARHSVGRDRARGWRVSPECPAGSSSCRVPRTTSPS